MKSWRRKLWNGLLCAIVIAGMMGILFGLPVGAFLLFKPLVAAPSVPAATAEPIEQCSEWRKAGVQVIHKCVDDEPPYAICYVPVGGVMQCLIE